ncbi:MAG: hypothetical protein EBX70_06295 [Betaproteobacteria bacterium]|nr:hypothetical protein [Betaproteobacteria bacterium]
MSTESAFLRFRAFMTPGRTLSAMLFLFIALPSVVVWSGVASFGAGKGAGATSGEGEGKETAKTVSDLDVASAKAKALMSGHTHVLPAHLQAIALPVLRHRIVTNFNAEADGVTSETVVQRLLEATPVDAAADARPLDRLIS